MSCKYNVHYSVWGELKGEPEDDIRSLPFSLYSLGIHELPTLIDQAFNEAKKLLAKYGVEAVKDILLTEMVFEDGEDENPTYLNGCHTLGLDMAPFKAAMVEPKPLYVHIDIETTGLHNQIVEFNGMRVPSVVVNRILEVGVLLTDTELNVVGDGYEEVVSNTEEDLTPNEALCRLPKVVWDMHTKSGLLDKCRVAEKTIEDVELEIIGHLRRAGYQPGTSPLFGNSIALDRGFIEYYMPRLNRWLHYRQFDISTLKEYMRRFHSGAPKPVKSLEHRALVDIEESIAELALYHSVISVKK